jgi:hypothetical protein
MRLDNTLLSILGGDLNACGNQASQMRTHLYTAFWTSTILGAFRDRGPFNAVRLSNLGQISIYQLRRWRAHIKFPDNLDTGQHSSNRVETAEKRYAYTVTDTTISVFHDCKRELAPVFVHEEIPENMKLWQLALHGDRRWVGHTSWLFTFELCPGSSMYDTTHSFADTFSDEIVMSEDKNTVT